MHPVLKIMHMLNFLDTFNVGVTLSLTQEEHTEHTEIMIACIKAFLLLLLGYTIFADKNSITIKMLWMLALQDMDKLVSWSWGAMGLSFLYEQLSLTSNSFVSSCGDYMTLFVVIIVFLIFTYWIVNV